MHVFIIHRWPRLPRLPNEYRGTYVHVYIHASIYVCVHTYIRTNFTVLHLARITKQVYHYVRTVQLKGNLTPARRHRIQTQGDISTGLWVPIGIFPVLSKTCL